MLSRFSALSLSSIARRSITAPRLVVLPGPVATKASTTSSLDNARPFSSTVARALATEVDVEVSDAGKKVRKPRTVKAKVDDKTDGGATKKPKARKADTKPKEPVKKKPKRVLQPPTKPGSPYLIYYRERLSNMTDSEKREIGGIPQLASSIGKDYKTLSESEKQKYQAEYERLYKEYTEKLADYEKKYTPQMIIEENEYRRMKRLANPGKKRRKFVLIRDPTRPITPLNNYMRFCAQVREDSSYRSRILSGSDHASEDLPSLAVAEQGKILAQAWKDLPQEEKDVFNKAFLKDLEVYKQQSQEWKEKNGIKA